MEIWRALKDASIATAHDVLKMKRSTTAPACLLLNSMLTADNSMDPENVLILIATTKQLVALSLDPTDNFDRILKFCQETDTGNASNIFLFVLAEILQATSIMHIQKLIDILTVLIVDKELGHPVIRQMILDGLIQITAYPSFEAGRMRNLEQLMNAIQNQTPKFIADTSKFNSNYVKMNHDLLNARDVSIILETNEKLRFQNLTTEAEKFFWSRNQLVLRGFFHMETMDIDNWNVGFKNLIEISKSDDELKSSLVMPLLFKLSTSTNPIIKLSVLQNMIRLGATTDIFSTIKALTKGLIRSMSIDLHLRLWKEEPRTYPFLLKVIVEMSATDPDDKGLEIVRASAIKEICDLRPQHGPDLVSTISEILNTALDLKDGEVQASLAIDSIVLLCQNHVINIVSTWKAINLKTRYEKRPRIIKSLCNFFSIVPSLKRSSFEYENLVKEILARLWHMIQWSDKHGIECATQTIRNWNYDLMTMDTIPDVYREGIALPAAPAGMEVSILDMEVPGECFIQVLCKVHPDGLSAVGDLLKFYIGCEILDFRSGHYLVTDGQPEPVNFKKLPKQSILKALTHFVIQQANTKKSEKLVSEAILVESLKILAHRFSRPLPPLNWCFLHELLFKSEDLKAQSLRIAAKQSIISGTAKRLIENFLVNLDGNDQDDVETALISLVDICNGVSSEVLRTFCESIFKKKEIESTDHVVQCLKDEKHVTNRDNLALLITAFIAHKTPPVDVVKLIPQKLLDAISIHLTPKQKIECRFEILKFNKTVENPILWVTELVTEQFMDGDHQEFFIKCLMKLLMTSDTFPKKKWLTSFIIVTQNRMVECDLTLAHTWKRFRFLIEIFIISVIIASGYFNVYTRDDAIKQNRLEIFPQSIELLVSRRRGTYDDIAGNIFEFLLHVIQNHPPDEVKETFKTAIVISKNHDYFKLSNVWQKFLAMNL